MLQFEELMLAKLQSFKGVPLYNIKFESNFQTASSF